MLRYPISSLCKLLHKCFRSVNSALGRLLEPEKEKENEFCDGAGLAHVVCANSIEFMVSI